MSSGGDAGTTACIAGAIIEALHGGLQFDIPAEVFSRLDATQWFLMGTLVFVWGIAFKLTLERK